MKADPDRVNVAFPDEGAQYWAARFTAVPGTDLVIEGAFPRARYISFHLYEGSMPVDAIADVEIRATGNPFLPGAERTPGSVYRVSILAGTPQPIRQPNTLYAHGLNGEPLLEGTILYRVYLPEGDLQGGVPLPSMAWEVEGPDVIVDLPCQTPPPLPENTVNEQVRNASFPADAPGSGTAPAWVISRSGAQPTTVGPATVYTSNPFYANLHNEYLRLAATRATGDVVAFRAMAPTFPRTTGAPVMPGGSELRYWSICTNDLPTTRYVACIADEQMVLDDEGSFTVVVSDVDHKPSTLRPTDNWLRQGPYADYFILYRHMLPADDFAGAIQHADSADVDGSMGAYYPATVICTTARFELDRCGLA